jgi:hypothetical protein
MKGQHRTNVETNIDIATHAFLEKLVIFLFIYLIDVLPVFRNKDEEYSILSSRKGWIPQEAGLKLLVARFEKQCRMTKICRSLVN